MGQAASSHLSGTGAQLIKAAKAGDADAVTELISAHPALLSYCTFRNFGPAHYAARADHVEVLQQLVAKAEELDHLARQQQQQQRMQRPGLAPRTTRGGAHHPTHNSSLTHQLVNAPSDRGITPLMLAVRSSCVASVRLLLAKGADPWAVDKLGGRTALHYAAWRSGSVEILQLLIDAAGPAGPVHFPNRANTKYVDLRTTAGLTAVHFAVQAGDQEMLVSLLNSGANPLLASLFDCMDGVNAARGTTALHLAARHGRTPLVKQLLKAYMEHWYHRHLPDPRLLMDGDSWLPCQIAARRQHRALARMLLPSTPLASLFADGELELLGPSTLAAIAAAVLRSTLAGDLKQCVQQQQQHKQCSCGVSRCNSTSGAAELQGEAAGEPAPAGSACNGDDDDAGACAAAADAAAALDSRVRGHSDKPIDGAAAAGSAQLPRPASPGLSTGGSGASAASSASSEASDDVCGVCFDAAPQVVLWPCSHELCAGCCTHLLALDSRCVLACPFCRGGVAHLRPVNRVDETPQGGDSLPPSFQQAQQPATSITMVGAPLVM